MSSHICICGAAYKSRSGLYKHRRSCKDVLAINNYGKVVSENEGLIKQLRMVDKLLAEAKKEAKKQVAEAKKEAKKQLDAANKRIDELTADNKRLSVQLYGTMKDELKAKNEQINGAGNIIGNQSKTLLNLLRKHADDAPVLKYEIDDDEMTQQIKGSDVSDIGLVLINHHVDGNLHSVLGDVLVTNYQKNNVKQQSMWSTDVARLTYLVKEIGKKGSLWTQDKKGNKVKKSVIKPLLKKIKTIIETFNANILETPTTEIRVKMERHAIQLLHEIGYKGNKNTSILADKINKYIAGHMHFDEKNKSKLVKLES